MGGGGGGGGWAGLALCVYSAPKQKSKIFTFGNI